MEPGADNPPLIVIVGPTASGKSSLALRLASWFNGEIICADSRTIYKGMDIGTAKPSTEERAKIPHHLLDITTPDKPITVADFKILAEAAIAQIRAKGKVPFLVGGTGLYIDAIIFNFSFRGKPDFALRQELNRLSLEELQNEVVRLGLSLPKNIRNKRHVIRTIESGGEARADSQLRSNTLILGIELEKAELEERIATRIRQMARDGLVDEARQLSQDFGWDYPALQSIGYQEFRPYFEGSSSMQEVEKEIMHHSLQYAKRQKTWFKRNKYIHYLYKVDDTVDLITTFLNKKV